MVIQMIKYSLPKEINDVEVENFVNDKYGNVKVILNRNRDFIKERIKKYQKFKKVFHSIPKKKSGKDLHDALLMCYSSETNRFKEYLAHIQELAPPEYKNRCPYCGIGEPNTVDHILPKAIFPEYSFLPLNLIYVCSVCNTSKSDNYRLGKNRLFINHYIDDFLNLEFTEIVLEVDQLRDPHIKYDFNLNLDNIVSNRNKETIKMHFKELSLFERIGGRINTPISENYRRVIRQIEKGDSVEEIKEYFREEEQCAKGVYGTNHFKTSVFRAFGNSDYVDKLYEYLKS
jgi:hypothetical protein